MGQVIPKGQLKLNYFRGSYPFQTQPQLSLPDLGIHAAYGNAAALDGLVVDKLAAGIHTNIIFVPHNQRADELGVTNIPVDNDAFVDVDLPDWTWDLVETWDNDPAPGVDVVTPQCFRARHYGHQTMDFVWDSDDAPGAAEVRLTKLLGDAEAHDTIQGFVACLSRTVYPKVPRGEHVFYGVRFKISETLYSFRISNNDSASFRKSTDDGDTWKSIAEDVKIGTGFMQANASNPPERGQQPLTIAAIVLNDRIQLRIGNTQTPLVCPIALDGDDEPVMTKVIAFARCFTQFNCEIHPVKFGVTGQMLSNPHSLGFSPANTVYYKIAGIGGVVTKQSGVDWEVDFPAGSVINVANAGLSSDVDQQYLLTITNPEEGTYGGVSYAAMSAMVTRVSIEVDGIWASAPTVARNVIPKSIRECTSFDPNDLTIHQSLTFTLNNFYGQWRGQAGNIAVQMLLGYESPATDYFYRFTGMCGRYEFDRPTSNVGEVTFECKSLMRMFDDQYIYSPPIMDGWNHYYAMAYLAQLAGVATSQMAFAALVPSDPYSASGFDPAPYFLPVGDGMRPWTPRDREMPISALMSHVRRPAGFMLFFDAQGYLRYQEWVPFSPGTHVAAYTEGQTPSDGSNLSEYFNLRLVSDISQVRNQFLLLGINPYASPYAFDIILNKLEDTASIYASPGFEPKNYVGYKKPFVWSDARFADPDFAAEAAARLYRQMRIPGLSVTFEAWMQPALYPMDVIFIDDHKSGTEGVPFYVMDTTNHWAVDHGGGVTCRSYITGQFLVD